MILSAFIEGLQILKPHYKDGDGYHLGAEHDQFYAYATETPLTEVECAKLWELGWFQPDAPVEDGGHVKAYQPEDGWSAFV